MKPVKFIHYHLFEPLHVVYVVFSSEILRRYLAPFCADLRREENNEI